MKDIFEILKHENHKLEVIEYGGEYVFGCKECGKTLLTETYVKENMDEYKIILNTLKDKNSLLYNDIRKLGTNILKLTDKAYIYMKEQVLSDIKELESKTCLTKSQKVFKVFDVSGLLTRTYKNLYNIKNCEELIKLCFSDEEINKVQLLIKDELLKILNEHSTNHSFYDNNEAKIAGCKKYKIISDYYRKQYMFFSINDEIAEELEKECPTPTDVYIFKDIKDFYNKQPDWEDEEEDTPIFNEYICRIENDLYDFRNIEQGKNIIIKDAMQYFSDFDSIERHIIPLRKILKEKYDITF